MLIVHCRTDVRARPQLAAFRDPGTTLPDVERILGRFSFTLIFFLSGITHFSDMPGYVRLMHESIPFREFWVAISGAVELAGAIMILFDRYARLGAGCWCCFWSR